MGLLAVALTACSGMNLFGPPKLKEEPIIPAQTLYQGALDDMDRQYYQTAITKLEKLERQQRLIEANSAALMQPFKHIAQASKMVGEIQHV